MQLTDWRGTPITVGCTIIYSNHMGRRTEVTEGTVQEIQEGELIVSPTRNTQGKILACRVVHITAVGRVTVLIDRKRTSKRARARSKP
jgi:hypothetical protein